MAIEARRDRERNARRRLIVTTARRLAETEGWDAVTTRRLSTEIEYSQPVLYKHFSGMDQIAAAVAVDGFGELTQAIRAARADATSADDALKRIAHAYNDFAHTHPAVYDAMFTRTTTLPFATENTPPELAAAFAELRDVVGAVTGEHEVDSLTEVLFAALHGLVVLGRAGRIRPDLESERLRLLVARFTGVADPN
ncbi:MULTISPECIES: TetR/AcrR family transcriptional regulator [Mycobacteriaceae]|uniref:TetR/AcrR family transcriptional regulator n=1 Tax=Mycobacteriaceae TaxID=1762 RepID=UPI0008002A30|nr:MULTISPECIES: TetR/AcrR family transcriptional regulator [Mycobacteriaceae]MCK0174220.1 TetR/AcrR family transcriptional regulator [Mycolicibacterium sp. F2034L]OBB60426.1 TetR family transcriptional regulator [Mycobacterium sp. 852013-51886_SCH5428379]